LNPAAGMARVHGKSREREMRHVAWQSSQKYFVKVSFGGEVAQRFVKSGRPVSNVLSYFHNSVL
jgi:hypothetical protein